MCRACTTCELQTRPKGCANSQCTVHQQQWQMHGRRCTSSHLIQHCLQVRICAPCLKLSFYIRLSRIRCRALPGGPRHRCCNLKLSLRIRTSTGYDIHMIHACRAQGLYKQHASKKYLPRKWGCLLSHRVEQQQPCTQQMQLVQMCLARPQHTAPWTTADANSEASLALAIQQCKARHCSMTASLHSAILQLRLRSSAGHTRQYCNTLATSAAAPTQLRATQQRRAHQAAPEPARAAARLRCTGWRRGESASCRTGPTAHSGPPTPAQQQQQVTASASSACKVTLHGGLTAAAD